MTLIVCLKRKILQILKGINLSFNFVLSYFASINDYIVKSDDEDIENLLERNIDKVKFQNAIDELLKENKTTKQITIKNRSVTISI